MADWYYSQGADQRGPVSDERLRDLLTSGEVTPSDSAWRAGMAEWATISSIPELRTSEAPRREEEYRRGDRDDYPRDDRRDDQRRDDPRRDDYVDERRPASGGFAACFSPWSAILVGGAFLWFINFFLPWYSIFGRTALGFNVGVAIFAFIVAIPALGAIITSWFVPILAQWRWTGGFFFGLMAFILLILGFFQFHGGANSVGPFFHLFATLVVLAGAVLEAVFGLLAFLKRMRTAQSSPERRLD